MAKYQLHIESNWPIKKKVEILQEFLGKSYFHPNGFMYSMWYYNDKEIRPFQREDFGPFSFLVPPKVSESPEGYLHGENSAFTAGLFLNGQALRYQVTGEAQALEFAQKAFHSINQVFQLTEAQGHHGYLCKPYHWQISTQTSPDQYICVMHGLWQYYKIASFEHKQRIKHLLPAMADWWKKNDYTLCCFFGVNWPILPHHAPAMACLNSMAYKVSGRHEYLQECRRLLHMAEAWPTWPDRNRRELYHNTGFPVEKKGVRWPVEDYGREYDPSRRAFLLKMYEIGEVWLTAACADYFMQQDETMTPLLKHALYREWENAKIGLREDLLTYYMVQYDLENNTWHPIARQKRAPDALTMYDGELCWMDGNSRIMDCAVMAHHHASEFCPGAFCLYQAMSSRLDDRRLHWFIDPAGDSLEPAEEPIKEVLSSDVPVFTILAYWRAKLYDIDIA